MNLSFQLADLTACTACLLCQYFIYNYSGLQREKEGLEALLEQSRKQYEAAKANAEQVNIKCHDLKHQLRAFRQEGRVDDGVLTEMEKAIDDYDAAVHTGNAALDVILTEKSRLCAQKEIGFTCMADGAGLDYMEPADLYALFGNALDNAMEAADALTDPEKKQISLTVRRVEGFSVVHLQNYIQGTLTFAGGLPMTTKADKSSHGFGARSMQLLAEKYGGEIAFQQEGEVFDLCLLLPCKEAA